MAASEGFEMTSLPIGEIGLHCGNCGDSVFQIPEDASDDSRLICNGCGEDVGSVAEARAEAVRAGRAAMPDIAKELQRALGKSLKNFKPKF